MPSVERRVLLARILEQNECIGSTFTKGKESVMVRVLVACILVLGLVGCGLGNDDGSQTAVRMVQDFKPTGGGSTLAQMVASAFPAGEWDVTKTSESLYRVIFRPSSGESKELVFGVSINKHHVMALNRDALAFTNPR